MEEWSKDADWKLFLYFVFIGSTLNGKSVLYNQQGLESMRSPIRLPFGYFNSMIKLGNFAMFLNHDAQLVFI